MSRKPKTEENVLILNGVRYSIMTYEATDSPALRVKSSNGNEIKVVKTKLYIEAVRMALDNDYHNETT